VYVYVCVKNEGWCVDSRRIEDFRREEVGCLCLELQKEGWEGWWCGVI